VLGVFYLLIDARGWRGWAFPLVVLGANAIFAYAVPILVKVHLLQEWTVKAAHGSVVSVQQAFMNFLFLHAGRIAGGWLYTGAYIVFWWLVLLWLYRRRIFLRV
jgi:predicted acyltransferase